MTQMPSRPVQAPPVSAEVLISVNGVTLPGTPGELRNREKIT